MTAISNRNTGLDLIRSLAIVLILLLHASIDINGTPELLKRVGAHLWFGVDIFFVLSGYLIGRQTLKQDSGNTLKAFKIFWTKRWFRTLPLYFFVLFFYVLVKPLLFGTSFQGDWSYYFFFIQNFLSPQDFVQSWSLCIEEQFYIFFPMLIFLIPRIKQFHFIWLLPVLISLYFRWIIYQSSGISTDEEFSFLVRFPTHTHLDGISFGVFLAATETKWKDFSKRYYLLLTSIGLIGLSLTMFFSGHTPSGIYIVLCFLLLSIFSSILVMGGLHIKVNKYIYKYVYWCAATSYGMYLWNNAFMRFAATKLSNMHWLLVLFIFLGATYFMSYLTFKFIEEPFMKIRNRVLSKLS